jgi:hypothetical protein
MHREQLTEDHGTGIRWSDWLQIFEREIDGGWIGYLWLNSRIEGSEKRNLDGVLTSLILLKENTQKLWEKYDDLGFGLV